MANPAVATPTFRTTAFDRMLMNIAPTWALNRVRARAMAITLARHYEAASSGRRTSGWTRSAGDANSVIRPAQAPLREHARDLVRNNPWARRARGVIANNTVGWGIQAAAEGDEASGMNDVWKRWAGRTECDADGRLTFAGIQALCMKSTVEAGEILVRRRPRRLTDGLTIPLQLQVLEPDFLDTMKDGVRGQSGGPIIQGIEYDALGRRSRYWLFEEHPGSSVKILGGRNSMESKPVPASDIIHVYDLERPGQARGMTWFAPVIPGIKDFDEYEDASLMQAKIAALFAAVITDLEGERVGVGEPSKTNELVETMEPGMMLHLPVGKDVKFGVPPVASENGFSTRTLRRVAAGFGITYEELTGDYSQVNFSSARMARLAHYANVHDWRWNMLIPQLCDGVWAWAAQAAGIAGAVNGEKPPLAVWTPPPMPMIDPDKEGLALQRLVRAGAMTHDEMVSEQGQDPETFWKRYADGLARLDKLGIWLDSDVRRVSAAGLTQERVGGSSSP